MYTANCRLIQTRRLTILKQLVVNMFGDFTIKSDDKIVSDTENRSRKLWFSLAYLIYNRHRVVKPNELIDVLWGENERGANSVGALKTLFYRARSVLDTLWDGAGKQLILNQSAIYGIRISSFFSITSVLMR